MLDSEFKMSKTLTLESESGIKFEENERQESELELRVEYNNMTQYPVEPENVQMSRVQVRHKTLETTHVIIS